MLSLGLSFPRPFDDNSHDGMNGEMKLVRVFFVRRFFLVRLCSMKAAPRPGKESIRWENSATWEDMAKKGMGNWELARSFCLTLLMTPPTLRRSHPRLKEFLVTSLDIVFLLSMLSLQRRIQRMNRRIKGEGQRRGRRDRQPQTP